MSQRTKSWNTGMWTHRDVAIHSVWRSQRTFIRQMSSPWLLEVEEESSEWIKERWVKEQSIFEGRGLRRVWYAHGGSPSPWGSSTVRVGDMMAEEAGRCMWDPTGAILSVMVIGLGFTDRQWGSFKVSKQEKSPTKICISEGHLLLNS